MTTVRITKSPWREPEPPPWEYSATGFKDWVYEVLLDNGKFGGYPRTVYEAIDIAEANRFDVEIVTAQKSARRKR